MTYTVRTLILIVLAATAGVVLGASLPGDPPDSGARPSTRQFAESSSQDQHSPGKAGRQAPVPAARRAGLELAELVHDLAGRRRDLDDRQTEITRIEDLGIRITDWAGTDNDPLLDRLVEQRNDAVLALVGGHRDLALRTLRHLAGGLGVVEAVERSWAELFVVRGH